MFFSSHPRPAFAALALAALSNLALAGGARAQGWLADRQRTEGPGIRVGDFELHPGIGVEIGYDSNLYFTSDDPHPSLPPRRDSAILRVTPHFYFSTLGPQRRTGAEGGSAQQDSRRAAQPVISFRGGVNASYYEFFNDERRRNLSIGADVALTVTPSPVFQLAITDQFARSIRPFTENTFETSTARDQNTAGIHATFSTEGNVFQVRTGYRFGLDYFEGALFRYGNSFTHTVEAQQTFRFLPQTGIIHEIVFAYRDYFERGVVASSAVFDGAFLTSRIGINGVITPEISLLAMVGYSAGFFDTNVMGYDQDYESFVAHTQLTWRIAPNVTAHLGYMRTFQPAFIGNYYSQDRGYLGGQLLLGGSFLLGIDAGVAYVDFGQIIGPGGMMIGTSTNREDVRVDASLFAEYRFTDWLGINGTASYQGDFTDFRYNVDLGSGMGIAPDPAGYNKFELWLGVRVFY